MARAYCTYEERTAPNGRRYLSAFLVSMAQDAAGVWVEIGRSDALASFPADVGSPWLEGAQRHARRFAFAHPATVEWVTPR